MSSPIALLDKNHCSALQKAISNVVDTKIADATFAQIIDGLPTEDVAWDRSRHKLRASHPLSDHIALCPGVSDKVKAIKADFQIDSLDFSSSIAVRLFQLKTNLHDPATTQGFDVDVSQWCSGHGVADMVGYWAEDRILGGVAIFDRSKAWTGENEPNVYFQSCRKWSTWRAWQLLPEQQDTLVEFLLREPGYCTDSTESPDGPLPLMPSRANIVRIDPVDAIPVHKVYRDIWEREPPPKRLRMQEFMTPCVVNSDDYPEMESAEDELKRLNELHRKS
ncbi:hypothetical protein DHEL01_v206060 [Diaporthe helianthi]|uniref:Uncharacterized protein n=1 Tax=Diaporthe helianthi TaxID=158607 RepID=A0A2P5HZ73_DIAHE|nr:hypothetical protein DHEL01_v206060 [Diaporthe helianthi]